MKKTLEKVLVKASPEEFENFGYQSMIESGNKEHSIAICGLHLYAYADKLQHDIHGANSELIETRHKYGALRTSLYDRPVPVSDAKMLAQRRKIVITLLLAALALIGCFGSNAATFILQGAEFLATLFFALCLTIFPAIAGHLTFEAIFAGNRRLQIVVALVAALLVSAGLLKVGAGRLEMMNRAASTQAPSSYIDGEEGSSNATETLSNAGSESRTKRNLNEGAFYLIMSTELAAGFFIGRIVYWHTDEDYVLWREVQKLSTSIRTLESDLLELTLRPETAKRYCLAGILRAQNTLSRRRPQYHRSLTILLIVGLTFGLHARAQKIERLEVILIDTSGSISHGGRSNELFHEYLMGTQALLLTEPPNTRVVVATISTDSFGSGHEILNGRTPESHGVFTDDLNDARRQLAQIFRQRSSTLVAKGSGTDIFGALWRIKAILESEIATNRSSSVSKEIWIFSDMMNETSEFSMPELLDLGPRRMLKRVTSGGLLVPLKGYRVHICGVSTNRLTPRGWTTVKQFWSEYFLATSADLVSYSVMCDVKR